MAALQRSRLAFRSLLNQSGQRRGLAAHHEPEVTWSQYRSGEKSLSDWVDGNRARVAFGFFIFYSSLAAWNLRPRSKKASPKQENEAGASSPSS